MEKNSSSQEDRSSSTSGRNRCCNWPIVSCPSCQTGLQGLLITSLQTLEINEDEWLKELEEEVRLSSPTGEEDTQPYEIIPMQVGSTCEEDKEIQSSANDFGDSSPIEEEEAEVPQSSQNLNDLILSQGPKEETETYNESGVEEMWGYEESIDGGAVGSEVSMPGSHSLEKYEQDQEDDNDKWECQLCTYLNWPRALKCVMCLNQRSTPVISLDLGPDPWPPFDSSDNRIQLNNLTRNNRGLRGVDRRWFEACHGVVDGNLEAVEAYLEAGGDPSRQLTEDDMLLLDRPSAFEVGLTLIHVALRFQQENLLGRLLARVDSSPPVVKRVVSSAAPALECEVRRHVLSMLREPRGTLGCRVVSEIATFTLPAEIEDFDTAVQETIFDDLLDRDVQKELEEDQIINWSPEVLEILNSRLYALWNRSAGDCLLDSVLQATWAIFDKGNGLRQALFRSLQDCSSKFYTRWRYNENMHARLLNFSLNESQCVSDFTNLISLASKPGSSLEQLHIFVLSHILRRPIIVYGVKVVKSFRGETLGYAHFEGLYLPLFLEPTFCYKSPICLGYTRGHFAALVTMDPDCDPLARGRSHEMRMRMRCSYFPLTTTDGNLLPIHFLSEDELGQEEVLMSQWLDVRYTESGLMVATQQIQTPPLLVGQMTEEWLNSYRPLARVTPQFLRPPPASSYSSDGESDS